MNWKKWLKGLISAIIGAAANSITVMIANPEDFNLSKGLGKLGSVMVVSAIVAVAMYFKKSPPPGIKNQNGNAGLSLIAMLSIFMIIFSGCAYFHGESKMCLNIPEGQNSVICEIAEAKGITPEALADVLYIGQIIYLETDSGAAQQANKFLLKIRRNLVDTLDAVEILGAVISFDEALSYASSQYDLLPRRVQLAIMVLDPEELGALEIKNPVSPYDLEKMIECVDKLLSICSLYL